jgi:hypothetical protein
LSIASRCFRISASQRFRVSTSGSSLVTTLLVVTVLAIIVVAFMQSMSIERMTSRSYANVERARLAAEAGVNDAMVKLSNLMADNPWHAIGYQRVGTGPAYPILFGSTNFNVAPSAFQLVSNTNSAVPLPALNTTNEKSAELGWIGTPAEKVNGNWTQQPVEMRAPWVNILADPTRPNQPNPNQPNFNPVVQRFAYWVEDETAKLDLRLVGNANGADGAFARQNEPGRNPRQLDLGALPLNNGTPLQDANGNQGLITFLNQTTALPKDEKTINFHEVSGIPGEPWDSIKFHATLHSVSNELAGTGKRRANLNHIVTNSNDPNVIAADLDDIIYVITGQHIFGNSSFHNLSNGPHQGVYLDQPVETGPLPSFGRRFYTNPAMPPPSNDLKEDHEKTYLLKIAANIRDYIDSDSQPTYVDADGRVRAGAKIDSSWRPGEEPIALGKEAIPYFQEHAWVGRIISMEILNETTRRIGFSLDHYFEFYNPSLKSWVAPAGTFLSVRNLPQFDAGSNPWVDLPDFELDLSGLEFPAGAAVVVTTAPSGQDPIGLVSPGSIVYRPDIPESSRRFMNVIGNVRVGSPTSGPGQRRGIRFRGRSSTGLETDYESELLLGTNNGLLMGFPALGLAGSGSPFEMTISSDSTQGTWTLSPDIRDNRRFIWTHSLRGNDSPSRSGDPRSLTEMLEFVAGSNNAFGYDQARFFGNFQGDVSQSLPGTSTIGRPGMSFVNPVNWPDYHTALQNDQSTAFAVVADDELQTIGELGNIYDPHRKLSPPNDGPVGFTSPLESVRIRRARGGGRTLKIGQIDDLVNPAGRFSSATDSHVSWFNGAWRLTDIFSADDASLPESAPSARGKININGILRDSGTAFRAALRGLRFLPSPDGDPARAGNLLSEQEIDTLVDQAINYLRTNGPMMCRGELGQLPFFSAAGDAGRAGGQPSSTSMDRSREEIFRRVVELITTRSLSFRVFAVGQAVRQNPNGTIEPISSHFQQALLNLTPQINSAPNSRVESYQGNITYVQP